MAFQWVYFPSNLRMETKVLVLGGEGAGKTTLTAQLKALASSAEDGPPLTLRPGCLSVQPTTGQECDNVVFNPVALGYLSVELPPLWHLRDELIMLQDPWVAKNACRDPANPKTLDETHSLFQDAIFLESELVGEILGDEIVTQPHCSPSRTLVSVCGEGNESSAPSVTPNSEEAASVEHHFDLLCTRPPPNAEDFCSPTARFRKEDPLARMKTSWNLALKEVGGRMISLWPRFIKDDGTHALIYVIDCSNPHLFASSGIEFLRLVGQGDTAKIVRQWSLLVLLNKIRAPGAIDPVRGAQLLQLDLLAFETSVALDLTVIPCDTWTGEGMIDVVRWLASTTGGRAKKPSKNDRQELESQRKQQQQDVAPLRASSSFRSPGKQGSIRKAVQPK